MTLLVNARRIRSAVAGELAPKRERALRAHLHRCAACRGYYDRLSLLAPARDAAARERSAIEAKLFPDAHPAPTRARRAWALALVPAAVAAVLLLRPRPPAPDDTAAPGVTHRGPAGEETAAAAPTLALYASRKGEGDRMGPLRLVAEIPASGEAVVSLRDYVQLACRGVRSDGHLAVFARDDAGTLHQLFPGSDGNTRVAATDGAVVPVGSTIELAAHHRVGQLAIMAVWSPHAFDVPQVRATMEGGAPVAAPAVVLRGILQIEP